MNKKLLFYSILLLFINTICYAATKEGMKTILNNNHYAIEVNKSVIDIYPDDTLWFLVLNEYGYLTVVPMRSKEYDKFQKIYREKIEKMKEGKIKPPDEG